MSPGCQDRAAPPGREGSGHRVSQRWKSLGTAQVGTGQCHRGTLRSLRFSHETHGQQHGQTGTLGIVSVTRLSPASRHRAAQPRNPSECQAPNPPGSSTKPRGHPGGAHSWRGWRGAPEPNPRQQPCWQGTGKPFQTPPLWFPESRQRMPTALGASQHRVGTRTVPSHPSHPAQHPEMSQTCPLCPHPAAGSQQCSPAVSPVVSPVPPGVAGVPRTWAGGGVVAGAGLAEQPAAQRPVRRGDAGARPHLGALAARQGAHAPLRPFLRRRVPWGRQGA